jgi:hypothetical protein
MLTYLDLCAFLFCAAIWLGPLIRNATRGSIRLLHPISVLPLMTVYMLIPPLTYRGGDNTALATSGRWAADQWFLAEPMLLLAVCGFAYHAGVKIAGVSLTLLTSDSVEYQIHLKPLRSVTGLALNLAACAVLVLTILAWALMPMDNYGKGYYWIWLIFMGFQILPVLALAQSRSYGTYFLFLAAPVCLLLRSKSTFITFALALILYFQEHVVRMSKAVTAAIICLVLLTPIAVSRYSYISPNADYSADLQEISAASWGETFDALFHREYAFESFACVYQWRKEGAPWTHGSMLLGELIEFIPALLWPDKPSRWHDFPEEYLPLDFRGYDFFYARHLMSLFFLDFGGLGCLVGMFAVGYIFGRLYRMAICASVRRQESWPLLLYLCWAAQSKLVVESGFASSIPNAVGYGVTLMGTICLARVFAVPYTLRRVQ